MSIHERVQDTAAGTKHTGSGGDFKPTNAKDAVATTRLDLGLFPETAIAYGAMAMTEGHLKYGAYNYRVGGVLASVYISALKRHLAKWENGSDVDPKTLVHHLASVLGCCAIMIDAIECDALKDDRPPAVPNIEELYERMQKGVEHLETLFPSEKSPGRYTEAQHGTKVVGVDVARDIDYTTIAIASRKKVDPRVCRVGDFAPEDGEAGAWVDLGDGWIGLPKLPEDEDGPYLDDPYEGAK